MNRIDYEKIRKDAADEAFAQHIIASRTERSWLLQTPDLSGIYAAEIIVLRWGGARARVLVHGDCDGHLFGGYSGSVDAVDPQGPVSWIARSGPVYLSEKVIMGEKEAYAQEVAVSDVEDLRKEHLGEDAEELAGMPGGRLLEWEKALADARTHAREETLGTLSRLTRLPTYELSVGMVPHPSIFTSQAACRRLICLLRGELTSTISRCSRCHRGASSLGDEGAPLCIECFKASQAFTWGGS